MAAPAWGAGGSTVQAAEAGQATAVAFPLQGHPSQCSLTASSGRARYAIGQGVPRRSILQFDWLVPPQTRSAAWELSLVCDGMPQAQAPLWVSGVRDGPLALNESLATVHSYGPAFARPPFSGSAPATPAGGCASTASGGDYSKTPAGPGPWQVPIDPCNTEANVGPGRLVYVNCAYWAAEKRPDVWVGAVWRYGYDQARPGAWNIELDAARAGFPIDHTPHAGDLAVWRPNAPIGSVAGGSRYTASPGGHVAYVEKVNRDGTVVISQMGAGNHTGGYTSTLRLDPGTFFIHRLPAGNP